MIGGSPSIKGADELADAAAYITDESEVEYTGSAYDFQDDQFTDAAETLRAQLNRIGNTAEKVDM